MQGSSRPDRQLLDAAAFCSHLVKEGSVHAFLAEHRAAVFPDSMFEDLFPSDRGRPSVPAEVIATVMVLQALENLSDREACEMLRTSISWKVAAGLPLDDEGFHPTVLVLWRNKLRASDRPERIFEAVRAVVESSGVLAKKNRRALDSTVLDDAVQQSTITCPAGVTVTINANRRARFGKNCATCPMRRRCTKSKAGRTIVLNENHDLLAEARTQSMTSEFQHEYRTYRPMIERSIAWLVRGQARRLPRSRSAWLRSGV